VQFGHFADKGEGFFRCGCPQFLTQKTPDFLKLMMCLHGQGGRGLSQCGHFSDKGEGSIFRDFVRTSFMAAPNSKYSVLLLPRLFFTSNSAVFVGRGAKIFLPQGARYPLATLVA